MKRQCIGLMMIVVGACCADSEWYAIPIIVILIGAGLLISSIRKGEE